MKIIGGADAARREGTAGVPGRRVTNSRSMFALCLQVEHCTRRNRSRPLGADGWAGPPSAFMRIFQAR
jgi:hypothetical protein